MRRIPRREWLADVRGQPGRFGRTAVKIWTAMKRLNRRYDEWQARAAAGIVAELDHPSDKKAARSKRHISVWDLLSDNREPGDEKVCK